MTEVPPATNTDPNKVYFQILADGKGTINYGADGIQRLDYVVHSAERHGLKLVLPFFNNWSDYGGISAYNTAFGGNATSWYTDEVSQKVYRNYIKTIVNRYKKSNAIFAWELGNEPRCNTCPSSTIYNWASEISAYIKSLDNSHMVTLGDEGWLTPETGYGDGSYAYSGVEGVDFAKNLKIKTLDYGVLHLYPNSWGYNYTWGNTWIQEHDLIGAASGKPVILEEYGTPFPSNHTETEHPWQVTVEKSGLAADQIWQFGSNDLSIPGPTLGDVNTIYYDDAEYALLGKKHAANMAAKKVSSPHH